MPDKGACDSGTGMRTTRQWENVFLIERGQPEWQEPTIYWQQGDHGTPFGGKWVEDPWKATRYATEDDAREAVRLAYFRGTETHRIVSHGFELSEPTS